MGTSVTVEITGRCDLLAGARDRLDELERRWSRFLPGSEVSRLNATRGLPVFVSADTRRLVRHGLEAWRLTGGRCDPSVFDAVIAAGYDRSFEQIATSASAAVVARSGAVVPGCFGVEVDDVLGSVTLSPGVGFDPGAVGKGLAADLVAEWIVDQGAEAALVSVGGDIRMAGTRPGDEGWLIDVRTAPGELPIARLSMSGGGVATSTTRRRRWGPVGEQHHTIDPRTGRPAATDIATATVLDADAWRAEARATQLLLSSPEERDALGGGVAGLVLTSCGRVEWLGAIGDYLR